MCCWLRTTELNNETHKEKEEVRTAKAKKKGQASLSNSQVHGVVPALLHSDHVQCEVGSPVRMCVAKGKTSRTTALGDVPRKVGQEQIRS